MAKKKKEVRAVSKAEAFFIESHFQKKDVTELAGDLGLPVESVQVYLDALTEANFKPVPATPEKTGIEAAGFGVHDPINKDGKGRTSISVVMTQTASEIGDAARENSGRNETFFKKRVRNGIHVIDPEKPVR